MLTKSETLPGRGTRAESSGKGIQEDCTARLAVPGFMGMGLVSSLSLASYSGHSWRCTHCSAKMDSRKEDSGRWLDTWSLLLTFPKFFRLVAAFQFHVPHPDLPSWNNSCGQLPWCLARAGGCSQYASPNISLSPRSTRGESWATAVRHMGASALAVGGPLLLLKRQQSRK